MKKTLVALMALAGAAAASEPITLGSWFTDSNGDKQMTVEAVAGLSKGDATALDGSDPFKADGLEKIAENTTFTIDTGALYSTSEIQQGQVLDVVSIVLSSKHDTSDYSDGDRTLSITLNGNTYVSNAIEFSRTEGYGTMTYTFTGDNAFSFTVGDTLEASLKGTSSLQAAYGVFQGQTGVSNIIAPATWKDWQLGVMINATSVVPEPTPVVPEPATATLSLLALAGLAARRRRR